MGGLGNSDKASEASLRNPRKKRKQRPSNKLRTKPKSAKKRKSDPTLNTDAQNATNGSESSALEALPLEPFSFFLDEFQTANDVQVSSLELDSMKGRCILGKLLEGETAPGSPAVLIISTSAIRAIELLKGFRSLTQECHAVKLFSKHMKIEEQVELLKNRVNIASGTPSRIKKLIDIEALGLSRLAVVVLDIQPDVKGYSLFSLPQVRDEFWDLYKSYLHQRVVEGGLRICLFGPLQPSRKRRKKEVTSPGK
ncbi:Protein CMSS1, partial [Cucurbita argyrosperma subsp. sororia]